VTERGGRGCFLAEGFELPGGHGDVHLTGQLEVAVDAVLGDRGGDPGEVLAAEPLQNGDLRGPALQAVAEAVGERGGTESAVTPRGRATDPVGLDQDHVERGITFLGHQGGPQAGVPTSDHCQVAGGVLHQRRQRCGAGGVLQPERCRLGFRESLQRVHNAPFVLLV
jgi:hypothetical protein